VLQIGTSGWQYRDWRGRLYPEGLPQRRWLPWYAERFPTVEVNNTFYRLPAPETFQRWHDTVPDGFTFAVKLSRYLSHVLRLRDPEEPVARFLRHAEPLGPRLGPVLLQLPPDLRLELGRLRATLDAWPRHLRLAVEFRHPTWAVDEVLDLLHEHDVALVLSDRRSRPLEPRPVATATWGYVRLHEGRAHPWPRYGDHALGSWVERVAERWGDGSSADTFVYFNNDPGGAAVTDAERFTALARRAGLAVAEPPPPPEPATEPAAGEPAARRRTGRGRAAGRAARHDAVTVR
jgi:uncharacterized protein YecE (DUF72 family)